MASVGLSPLDVGRAITRHDHHYHLATDIIILGAAPLELENGSASERAFKWQRVEGGAMPSSCGVGKVEVARTRSSPVLL
jgi:hypothetical protein